MTKEKIIKDFENMNYTYSENSVLILFNNSGCNISIRKYDKGYSKHNSNGEAIFISQEEHKLISKLLEVM